MAFARQRTFKSGLRWTGSTSTQRAANAPPAASPANARHCGPHTDKNKRSYAGNGTTALSVPPRSVDRIGYAQITTTQKYLHTLPDADADANANANAKNLTALDRVRSPAPARDRTPPAR